MKLVETDFDKTYEKLSTLNEAYLELTQIRSVLDPYIFARPNDFFKGSISWERDEFWKAASKNELDVKAFFIGYAKEIVYAQGIDFKYAFTEEGLFNGKGIYGKIKDRLSVIPDSFSKALMKFWLLQYKNNAKVISNWNDILKDIEDKKQKAADKKAKDAADAAKRAADMEALAKEAAELAKPKIAWLERNLNNIETLLKLAIEKVFSPSYVIKNYKTYFAELDKLHDNWAILSDELEKYGEGCYVHPCKLLPIDKQFIEYKFYLPKPEDSRDPANLRVVLQIAVHYRISLSGIPTAPIKCRSSDYINIMVNQEKISKMTPKDLLEEFVAQVQSLVDQYAEQNPVLVDFYKKEYASYEQRLKDVKNFVDHMENIGKHFNDVAQKGQQPDKNELDEIINYIKAIRKAIEEESDIWAGSTDGSQGAAEHYAALAGAERLKWAFKECSWKFTNPRTSYGCAEWHKGDTEDKLISSLMAVVQTYGDDCTFEFLKN